MLRLRSRALFSFLSGIVAIGLLADLDFFTGRPDEKLVANFHRSPFTFVLVWAALGAAIVVFVFIVLSLIAWTMKVWSARRPRLNEGTRQLYSPNQAFGAVFLGGPLAAVALIKANYLTLGNPAYAKKAVVFGWSIFLAFVAAIFAMAYWDINLKGVGTAIGVATASTAKSLVGSLQQTKQAIIESDQYSFRSNWRVFGVGLFYLAASLAIMFVAAFILILAGCHFPK